MGKMPDGRIEAIKVTGPGGEKVKGQPHPKDEDEEAQQQEDGAGGKAVVEPKPKLKPYTGFMPRTVKPKPGARIPLPGKPKPPSAGGEGSVPSGEAAPTADASAT